MRPYFECEQGILYHADCLDVLPTIDYDINMVFADLPYEETGNKWDKQLDLDLVFKQLESIVDDYVPLIFTGTFKFGVKLYNTAPHLYKYDWVWEKDNGTNAPNVNLQPFRIHEQVYVFGKGRVTNGNRTALTYNPQKTEGKPYSQKSGKVSENWKGGLKNIVTNNTSGLRHPKTIQKFARDKVKLHSTQKPLGLVEYLIKTYSNENDIVLDFTAGSGTTAIACMNTNRKFILVEQSKEYCDIIVKRIQQG